MTARMRKLCRKLAEEIIAKQTAEMINSAPYVNRLENGRVMNNEALDKAVIERSGLWFTIADCYDKEVASSHYGAMYSHKSSAGNVLEVHLHGIGKVTHDEFTQRAKELGFINGYRWGVEYPTNGKRPDLSDDVKCSVKFIGNNAFGFAKCSVDNWPFDQTSHFKITDDKYKPADTSYLQTPAVEDAEEVAQGGWFELGILPPTGSVVAFYNNDGYAKTGYMQEWIEGDELEILSHKTVNNRILCVVFNRRTEDAQCLVTDCMRPLDHAARKSELEKKRLIEKAKESCFAPNSQPTLTTIECLIAAGWRPTKD